MKLMLDDCLDDEIKEYLLGQEGITAVDFEVKDLISEIKIDFDKRVTPQIILKYIDLFQNNQYSVMLGFDKEIEGNSKTIKYIIDDMCCEYCYKGLVQDLFENKFIKSVKSNFDFHTPCFNIEFFIEYNENYKEDELIEYIKEKSNI